jgi:hypothetical protein
VNNAGNVLFSLYIIDAVSKLGMIANHLVEICKIHQSHHTIFEEVIDLY